MSPFMVAMPVEARSLSQVALKLKRQGAAVEVVVVGLGANARVVTQTSSGSTWRGRLLDLGTMALFLLVGTVLIAIAIHRNRLLLETSRCRFEESVLTVL